LLGLAEIDCDRWLVRFADLELGTIDRTAPPTLRRAGAQALRSQSPSRPSTDRKTVTHLSGPNCHLWIRLHTWAALSVWHFFV